MTSPPSSAPAVAGVERGNDSAYPLARVYTDRDGCVDSSIEHGMTIRERFAMAAMQAILSSSHVWPDIRDAPEVAKRAMAFADAQLAALEQP